ncbi:MAG: Sec-independent protein translocase protein TatB [Dokdonella sp.]
MFDIGFGKLALIAVVALLVLGPERLPRVARTAGALVRRARNSWASVRAEIERELATDEIKRSIREAAEAVDIRADVKTAANTIHDAVRKPMADRAPAHQPAPVATDVESGSASVGATTVNVEEPGEPARSTSDPDSSTHERS